MTLNLKPYFAPLACALGTLLSLTPSHADTITSDPPSTTTFSAAAFENGFTLPAFDSDMGTLEGIDVSYNISSFGSVDVTTSAGTYFGGSINSSNFLYFPGIDATVHPYEISVIDSVSGGPTSGGTTTYTSGTEDSPNSTSGDMTVDPSIYSSWEAAGGGTLDLTLSAGAPAAYGGGSGSVSFSNQALSEGGSFFVTYTYAAAVPEPSNFNLLGAFLGLAVLFQVSRRIRSYRW